MSDPAWCSPENPHTGCSAIKGVCKPMTASVLAEFQELQRQLNRVLSKTTRPLVDVDGRIGPQTVASLQAVAASLPSGTGDPFGTLQDMDSCDKIAAERQKVISVLSAAANELGAPAQVTAPAPRSPPSMPAPGGGVISPSDSAISSTMCRGLKFPQGTICWFKGRPTWMQVGIGAVGGLFVLFAASKYMKKSAAGGR